MKPSEQLMTFGGHLDVLRRMLIRIAVVTALLSCVIFAFKDWTFSVLLAPGQSDFITYHLLEDMMRLFDSQFRFADFHVDLIATDLSSQFMTHISTSIYLGLLAASPFILFELFRFVSPALMDNERKYSVKVVCVVYALFLVGVLMSYYILFPISFQFLGTYSVSESVKSIITIDSYISTFVTLTIMLGLVFQLPVAAFVMAKMGIVKSSFLKKYRKHAFIIICVVAAIITPPDLMTLIVVAVPLYLLYEVSIRVVRLVERRRKADG